MAKLRLSNLIGLDDIHPIFFDLPAFISHLIYVPLIVHLHWSAN